MGGAEMRRRPSHSGAPVCEGHPAERLEALVGAGQIGQGAVDPDGVERAHGLDRQAAQAVALVEQRRDDQQAPGAAAREGEGIFLCHRGIRDGAGPAG